MRISDWSSDVCSSDLERLARRGVERQRQRNQQPLDGDVAVASLLRDLLGGIENTHRIVVEPRRLLRPRSRHRRDFGEREIGLARRLARVAARRLDQPGGHALLVRSEEHTSELQSLMRISYAVFCLKQKNDHYNIN